MDQIFSFSLSASIIQLQTLHMEWLWLSFIYGIALSMDCLALSIADGLIYGDLTQKKAFFIAGVFALGQGLFPLIGYLLGVAFSQWIDRYDHWVAFVLLVFIGGKMVLEGLIGMVKANPKENCEKNGRSCRMFNYPEVIFQGVADSIDALAVGITIETNIHADAGATYEIYLAFVIIALCTLAISLLGVFAGKRINLLLKGKYEISNVLGGTVLMVLGALILLEGLNLFHW